MENFTVRLYRYNSGKDEVPYSQGVEVDGEFRNQMVHAGSGTGLITHGH